ncbi:MAG: tail fiber protein [Candidatus Kapabacteria bacterium]|nr:tail fiber protein [Candidatus Kapabacteria bacterium]
MKINKSNSGFYMASLKKIFANLLIGTAFFPIALAVAEAQDATKNVGIGTDTPNASALLDLDVYDNVMFPTKLGLLIPRVSLTGTNDQATIASPVVSLLVYNINTTEGAYAIVPGFYYWGGSDWIKLSTNTETNTYLPLAGGTMTGAINGITDLTATGNIYFSDLIPGKYVVTSPAGQLATTDLPTYSAGTGITLTPQTSPTVNTVIAANADEAIWNAGKLQGKTIDPTAPTDGQTIVWDQTSQTWKTTALPVTNTPDRIAFFNSTGNIATNDHLRYDATTQRIGIGVAAASGISQAVQLNDGNFFLTRTSGSDNAELRFGAVNSGAAGCYIGIKAINVNPESNANNSHNTYILPVERGTQGQVLSVGSVNNSEVQLAWGDIPSLPSGTAQGQTLRYDGTNWVASDVLTIAPAIADPATPATVTVSGNLNVTGEIDPVAIIMQPQETAPTATEGKFYYDNAAKKIKVYDGTDWKTTATTDDLASSAAVPTGAIMQFAGAAAPTGWLLCNGAAVSRTEYAALYDVIGTTYSAGNSDETTFNLPNMQQRFPLGATGSEALGTTGGDAEVTLTEAQMPPHSHRIKLAAPMPTIPDGETAEVSMWNPAGLTNAGLQFHGVGGSTTFSTSWNTTGPPPTRYDLLTNDAYNVYLSAWFNIDNDIYSPGRSCLPLRYTDGFTPTENNPWPYFVYLKKNNVIEATGGASETATAAEPHNNMPPYIIVNYIIKY